jgi:hypothetical protein
MLRPQSQFENINELRHVDDSTTDHTELLSSRPQILTALFIYWKL